MVKWQDECEKYDLINGMMYWMTDALSFTNARSECWKVGADVAEFREESHWKVIQYYPSKWLFLFYSFRSGKLFFLLWQIHINHQHQLSSIGFVRLRFCNFVITQPPPV